MVSARKKAEKRGRHEQREKERKRRFGVNAIISFSLCSCLPLFSAFFLALTIGSINIF